MNIAVTFAFCLVQQETVKNKLLSQSVRKQGVFASKKHVPIGGKRHHTNQSQNYMAKHMIWLLRNREKSDSSSDVVVIETASFESFVTFSMFREYSYCVM